MRAKKFADFVFLILLGLAAQVTYATPSATDAKHLSPSPYVMAAQTGVQTHPGRLTTAAATEVRDFRFINLSPASEARAAAPATQAPATSLMDLLSLVLVVAMLVAYQLFRKHRQLRQHPFSL